MKRRTAAIFGAGGHARVVASTLLAVGANVIGFFDDSYGEPETIAGKSVLGRFSDIRDQYFYDEIDAVYLAIGDNARRRWAYDFLKENGFFLPALIHPTALIAPNVKINEASLICMGVILATDVVIGCGSIVNTGCSVDHETRIGDFVHLASRTAVAGRVTIGDNTFVGINTAIGDKVKIGADAVIGAGSIVLADVADRAKVLGVHH